MVTIQRVNLMIHSSTQVISQHMNVSVFQNNNSNKTIRINYSNPDSPLVMVRFTHFALVSRSSINRVLVIESLDCQH